MSRNYDKDLGFKEFVKALSFFAIKLFASIVQKYHHTLSRIADAVFKQIEDTSAAASSGEGIRSATSYCAHCCDGTQIASM